MRYSSAALPVVLSTIVVVACGNAPSTTSTAANLTQATQAQILASLSFLNTANSIQVVDPTSSDGQNDLNQLNAAIAADPDTTSWISNAGGETSPHIVSVGFPDGTSALVISREWLNGSASSPSSRSAIVYVTPPSAAPFGYAEQHVYQSGNVDVASFWTLDGGGSNPFQPAGGYTFNPANAEQQNIDGKAGNVALDQVDGGAGSGADGSSGTTGEDGGGGTTPEGGSASEDASGDSDGGTGSGFDSDGGGADGEFGAIVALGIESASSTSCALCANGMLAAKVIGIGAAYATGTGAATAVCALVGIPTAEVGGVACHLVTAAVSIASFLPWSFADRAADCNYVSATVLGMNPVCAGEASPASPVEDTNSSK